jgi:hypothetical protein
MRKALTIIISAIFLASGLQVSIDKHYCGGNLVATKVSLTGVKASCGMENADFRCSSHLIFDSKCCEDQMLNLALNNNFFPEYFHLDKPLPGKQVLSFQNIILSENKFSNLNFPSNVLPPGENIQNWLTQAEICVFRI